LLRFARNDGEARKEGQATRAKRNSYRRPWAVGEFLIAECSVVQRTRSTMFMQDALRVDDRVCATT
jgi:acyl-coenzyme A thioesterase PaaI-like protein